MHEAVEQRRRLLAQVLTCVDRPMRARDAARMASPRRRRLPGPAGPTTSRVDALFQCHLGRLHTVRDRPFATVAAPATCSESVRRRVLAAEVGLEGRARNLQRASVRRGGPSRCRTEVKFWSSSMPTSCSQCSVCAPPLLRKSGFARRLKQFTKYRSTETSLCSHSWGCFCCSRRSASASIPLG